MPMQTATAVVTSQIQKAFHTAPGPAQKHSRYAAGIITIIYLNNEITRDWVPLPSPSNAPEAVTEIADGINPILIIRNAVVPSLIVSGFSVNIPINDPDNAKQMIVPASMIIPFRQADSPKSFFTLFTSPAP